MTESQENKIAKRLAVLIADKGDSGVAEIKPALEAILKDSSDAEKKRFLKLFQKAITRELAKSTLTVESSAELDEATLKSLVENFQSKQSRPLSVIQKINPELISGLRVRLGDTVYDASISGKLNALAGSIN